MAFFVVHNSDFQLSDFEVPLQKEGHMATTDWEGVLSEVIGWTLEKRQKYFRV